MKELTIEEKAAHYDAAIERANELRYVSDKDSLQYKTIEHIFPELKESEDEKIRKELLEHCKDQAKPYIQTGNECPQIQSWIDWLEKQGEKNNLSIDFVLGYLGIKPAYKDGNAWCILLGDNIQEGICGFGDTKEEALIAFIKELIEKQGKKKSTNSKEDDVKPVSTTQVFEYAKSIKEKVDNLEPKFKVGDKIQYDKYTYTIKDVQEDCYVLDNDKVLTFNAQDVWELVEYNPANNIELSTFKNKLLELFQKFRGIIQGGVPTNGDIIDYVDAHIQELIGTIQNKTWSEEDEKMIEAALQFAHEYGRHGLWSWLKGLKDRVQPKTTWKPSDEQIEALEHFVRSVSESGYASPHDNNTKLVYSLLSDLKKLRG